MPRNRASYVKRQLEVAKKQKREDKMQRKIARKTAVVDGEPAQQPGTEPQEENR